MAVEYSIQNAVLHLEMVGVYEPQDVIRAFLSALNDPTCPRPVALLVDVARSESLATRPVSEIRSVAEFLGPFAERIGGRCAVVAPKDVQFGLSQLGSQAAEAAGITARVFRNRHEAVDWLREQAPAV